MVKIHYKPEVDGLRTVAVLSVIIYHLNPAWLPSGFIGVDLFLVISGFLITNIIIKSYEKNGFSTIDFYARRIKRIIPLTYVVLATSLMVGWFLSYPVSFRAEANSTVSALFFAANIRFALSGNYFNAADDNPLLHLWSLSLEEQFYFLWPLLIGLFYALHLKKRLAVTCLLLMAISIVLATYFVSKENLQQYAYFVLPTRMTGLLFGALLAITTVPCKKDNLFLALAGILLVGLSLFYIDKNSFPGISLLLPLIGAALIILTPESPLTKTLFANGVSTYIGRISFSLYMWHWPLLVYSKRYLERADVGIGPHDAMFVIPYLLTLFAISALSYRFIERRFRKNQPNNQKTIIYIFLLPLTVLTALSLYISKTNGLPIRYGLTDKMTRIETTECHNSLTKDYCYLNHHQNTGDSENSPTNRGELLLIGDSHAGALNHFVQKLAIDFEMTAYDASSGGCPFYADSFYSTQCETVKNKIKKVLQTRNIQNIIIAKRFDKMTQSDINAFLHYIDQTLGSNHKIMLFTQVPKLRDEDYLDKKFMDKFLAGLVPQGTRDIDPIYTKYDTQMREATSRSDRVFLLDLAPLFCLDGYCKILDEKGHPIYFDEDHLSAHGAEWLYSQFKTTSEFARVASFLTQTPPN